MSKKEVVTQQRKHQLQTRSKILEMENALMELVDGKNIVKGDSEVFPLKHTFTDGIYIRQMSLKKDSAVIGKIHKNPHVWFLLSGSLVVASETSDSDYEAPCYIEAPAGSKRIIYAHTNCIFVTVHATDKKDVREIEKDILLDNFLDEEKE